MRAMIGWSARRVMLRRWRDRAPDRIMRPGGDFGKSAGATGAAQSRIPDPAMLSQYEHSSRALFARIGSATSRGARKFITHAVAARSASPPWNCDSAFAAHRDQGISNKRRAIMCSGTKARGLLRHPRLIKQRLTLVS